MEVALRQWAPMSRPVQHVGVPGCQWQAGVYWNGSLIFGQILHRVTYVHPRLAEELALADVGDNLLHVTAAYGSSPRVYDRTGTGSSSVRRGLENGRLPIPWIETRDADGVTWHQTVFAYLLGRNLEDGQDPRPDDQLLVECRFTAANTTNAARTGRLWLHFADTSAAPTYSGQRPQLGQALPITFDLPFGVLGERVHYAVPRPASGEVVWHDQAPQFAGVNGAAERVLEWRVPLLPGQKADLRLVLPYGLASRDAVARALAQDGERRLEEVRQFWSALEKGPGQIITPDPFVNDYLAAVPGQMAQQTGLRHKAGLWMYKTSPNWYEDYYPSNAARALPVFDLRGLTGLNRKVLQSFLDFQSDDASGMMVERSGGAIGLLSGFGGLAGEGFARCPGYLGNFGLPVSAVPPGDVRQGWTANMSLMCHGAMLWSLANHYRITRDAVWLQPRLPAIIAAFDWVAFQRQRTKVEDNGKRKPNWGLLPAASAHDWLSGSTVFNDAWCIYGMAETVRLLREVGHPRLAECERELTDYRNCLRDRYSEARDRARPVPLADGTSIPYVPRMVSELDWEKVDWTYTGYGPLRAGGLGALNPRDELVTQALAFAEAGRPKNGDTTQRDHYWTHYVEPETHWPMYELFLERDDLPRFFELAFNNLAAAIHHDFRVGCEARDGVVSCAPGDAERWRMVRAMFVNERGGGDGSQQSLWLLQAVPRSWIKPGCRMSVRGMGTSFGGKVDLSLMISAGGDSMIAYVAWNGFAVYPREIVMRLRTEEGYRLASVAMDGHPVQVASDGLLRLRPNSEGRHTIVARLALNSTDGGPAGEGASRREETAACNSR